MNIKQEIIEFIYRRFKIDCNWLDGNCYYFAVILKDRFPSGLIYYDVISGHFVFKYENSYYDWTGEISPSKVVVEWNKFDEYDSLCKKRVVDGCIL